MNHMTRLLHIEWLKIKKYRAFILIGIFFILGIFVTNYIVKKVFDAVVDNDSAKMLVGQFAPFSFEHVWETVSYASGYLLILPAMLLLILTTNEFTFKTSRQNIIDGWTRQQFIEVKLTMAFIFAAISTLFVFLTGLLFASFSKTAFSTNGITHILYFFNKAFTYNIIALFMSILIRKTGFAIGMFFIYTGAENILAQILDLMSVKWRNDNGIDLGKLGNYLPMNASDGLLTFPENPLQSLAKATLPTNYFGVELGFSIGYLLLFVFLTRNLFIKRDL
jgi:ABC-2 type transport system permease protein